MRQVFLISYCFTMLIIYYLLNIIKITKFIMKFLNLQNGLIAFALMLLFPMLSQAQVEDRNCSAMDHLQIQIDKDPATIQRMEAVERHTQSFLDGKIAANRNAIVTIPVVFHVVWRSTSENISDAQLQSQLDVLNEDFRRLNADATNQWPQAADSQIEFCLASVDPNGNSTSGIVRVKTKKRSFSYTNDGVKFASSGGSDAWPTGDYLNIWVCNLGNGLLGYAQFPGSGAANTDGVVNDYAYTGRGGSAQSPYDLGRTATHEVGHWLNLRHIWGDGGCGVDDFVADTPESDASNGGCATGHVSCGSVDMVENYMDYSYDACMNLFTAGQNSRMQALFAAGGFRESLLSSNGCGGGTSPTCSDGVQNGNETGVDCGGPDCAPCSTGATCTDGIQNGNETGVDCGGPDCSPCSTGGTCDTPTGLFASNIKPKRAKLNWDDMTGAVNYTLELRPAGGSWQSFTASGSNLTISSLSNGTTYEWRVTTNCSGESSTVSSTCSFTAGNSGSGACGSNRMITGEEVRLYPNPASDFLSLELNMELDADFQVTVLDMYGRVMNTKVYGPTHRTELNISELAVGIYLLRVDTADGAVHVNKFMVRR